ncbi:GH12 family glycosyl hydrolase domain-containing protein [Catellatospora tritici]|uniref:GH12 family glycosyl hydrolase domain-containing protein n=1 Tax=Catellatospora tritici TaxID=2851566 RepID=UPI001C2D5FE5|nr:cellulose binding domain-containing protein [Catellatospora tritici]MBV1853094.1 cellulose binding domain-containing protein [Catellatospora tritici]
MRVTKHRLTRFASAVLLTVGATAAGLVAATPAHAATICEQYGTVVAGNYVIQNNRWGTTATQCINTTSNGFSITQQDGTGNTSGAPVSYPSIFLGCHYSNCSPSSPLPKQISTIGTASSSLSVSYPSSGTWDAAYDIWLNADTNVSGVQDTEIMIWFNRQGSIQPIGSQTGTANLAGRSWNVWTGNNGGNNVVSYLFTGSPVTSLTFDVKDFINDTFSRGSVYGNTNWYLTSVQAGFEPWIGGVGLAVNSFSASVTTGGGTQVPGTPGTPTASNVTASSLSLSWAASSGTVSGYQVERATGASSTSFSQVGAPTGTSFSDSGLAANTTYRYRVRATNSAGASGYSGIVNVTTTSGGGGGSGCTTTTSVQSSWAGGYVLTVTVTNSGSTTLNGWHSTVTLPSGHAHTGSWPATAAVSGQNVTEANVDWNRTLSPGQSTTWGLQATRGAGDNSLPTVFACTTP